VAENERLAGLATGLGRTIADSPPVGVRDPMMEKTECVRCGRKIVYLPCVVCTMCLMTQGDLTPDEKMLEESNARKSK
jgi:hypothetical protein